KRAYCLKTQPATGETYPKSDLFNKADFEFLLCHGTVCVVGKMRDLILQLSKSSIYSTKPTAS
ncbi:hypothetical protein KZ809_13605, partial [Enterobacter roggenkampii]|nr:hypothetical protein [Enterobacter roggenkampii]